MRCWWHHLTLTPFHTKCTAWMSEKESFSCAAKSVEMWRMELLFNIQANVKKKKSVEVSVEIKIEPKGMWRTEGGGFDLHQSIFTQLGMMIIVVWVVNTDLNIFGLHTDAQTKKKEALLDVWATPTLSLFVGFNRLFLRLSWRFRIPTAKKCQKSSLLFS